jgi:hypothetical protein
VVFCFGFVVFVADESVVETRFYVVFPPGGAHDAVLFQIAHALKTSFFICRLK